MSRVLPILFNTNMIQAILDGRKTVTRRCVRYKYSNTEMKMRKDKYGTRLIEIQKDIEGETYGKKSDGSTWHKLLPYIEKSPPYKKGDILYIRETFFEFKNNFYYKADGRHEKLEELGLKFKWRPSIHMPKEAARIFLKVTDVRVERLHDITEEQAEAEGLYKGWRLTKTSSFASTAKQAFMWVWDMTIKAKLISFYGWIANPWVWVVEFERCEKPEEL